MKLSFRLSLRDPISNAIYCGSNLAVLVCRLLPLQMCLECGTLAQSGHSQRPHLTTAIRQSPTLLPVYPPTRGQQGGHVTRYPPIRVSPHYWQSRVTSTYPPPVTSRENETEYTDLYEIMFITVCGAFPAWIWILTGYFLWGCLDIEAW